jgi:tetratricopeptide (TPR) repeat protein
MAKNALESNKYDEAHSLFRILRRTDPYNIDSLDYYAYLLMNKKDDIELNKLAHDVISINYTNPIGWIIVALFCELKNETKKALSFVEKVRRANTSSLIVYDWGIIQAIRLAPQYHHSFRVKGFLLLRHEQADKALISYFQANNICKDLGSSLGKDKTDDS